MTRNQSATRPAPTVNERKYNVRFLYKNSKSKIVTDTIDINHADFEVQFNELKERFESLFEKIKNCQPTKEQQSRMFCFDVEVYVLDKKEVCNG